MIEVSCKECGKKFQAAKCLVERGEKKFCSRACYNLSHSLPLAERFVKYVSKTKTESGCILWTGSTSKGYGTIRLGMIESGLRKKVGAHCVAWELRNGKIPDGLEILHSCDNRLCVNEEHLSVGTRLENLQDMVRKGRQNRGEKNGSAKLTAGKVSEIRRKYEKGNITQEELSNEFGVHKTTIGEILRKEIWKHI